MLFATYLFDTRDLAPSSITTYLSHPSSLFTLTLDSRTHFGALIAYLPSIT